jgi:hypothetical protein
MNIIHKTASQVCMLLLAMVTSLVLASCSADGMSSGNGGSGSPVASANDTDGDGVLNAADNCPGVANASQADMNGNGIGDACEDSDGDGSMDAADNCPLVANANQADANNNGIGDACEGDYDGDGVSDATDNCPSVANANQADANSNGIGDACDTPTSAGDTDGDGVLNASDNCPAVYNPAQTDSNSNGVGDVCEAPIKDICGAGFRPLLAPEADAFGSTSTLLSSVTGVSTLTDTNATNYATMTSLVDLLGILGTSYVGVHTLRPQAAGHATGFLVSTTSGLISLSALSGVTVQTLNGATVSETFNTGSTLTLTLLGGGTDPARLSFNPTKSYDGVRVNIGGVANVLSSLRVHAACTAL